MSESLKKKAVKGVSWSFIDNVLGSGITFLVGLILARILSIEEYGILAMITIFIAVSNSIVDSGFSNALIRKINVKAIDYNTAFYFNLVVSLLLYVILYLAAPSISVFFKEPILINVTRVIGLIIPINALTLIPRTILVRNVDFKTQTKASLISSVSSGIVGVGMALGGCGVWSMVAQQLLRQGVNSLCLWLYCEWRPLWEFSIRSFKELFGFGVRILFSGLLDTVYKNIYYIIIGRFYSSTQLGQYTRADQFKTIFSTNLTMIVQRVSYPVLSSIQNEPERLRQAYRKVMKVTMLITFACMLGLAAIAQSLIVILIGEKWLPSVSYLQILCFSGMLYPLHAINLNILQVKGRADLFLNLEVINKTIAVVPILIGIFLGIEYMLWGLVVTTLISYFFDTYYSARLINYPMKHQIKDIIPSFLVSSFVAGMMWGFSFLNVPVYLVLLIQCSLGILMALFFYEKLNMEEYVEVKHLILSAIKRK